MRHGVVPNTGSPGPGRSPPPQRPGLFLARRHQQLPLMAQSLLPTVSVMPDDGRTLTTRQVEILRLVADDLANEEIATCLGVTTQAVKNQLREMYRRLGVRGRAGAVARAYHLGLLGPPRSAGRRGRSQLIHPNAHDDSTAGGSRHEDADRGR